MSKEFDNQAKQEEASINAQFPNLNVVTGAYLFLHALKIW